MNAADDPVRGVDDFVDAEIARDARDRVGLLAIEAVRVSEPRDGRAHRVPCGFHQVRPDAGAHVVARLLVRGDRARRHVVLRRVDAHVLPHAEAEDDVHRRLDRRAAHLAVALRGVRVAEREERALDADGQVERDAGVEVLRVHVPAEAGGRHDGMLPRLRQRDAERAGERAERERHAVGEPHAAGGPVDLRDAQPRVGELVGEQAEAGDDRRPAPALRPELEQLDRERVARLRALDEDRAADRVDVREVELRARRRRPTHALICSSEASRTCRSTVSPDSISRAGSNELSQAYSKASERRSWIEPAGIRRFSLPGRWACKPSGPRPWWPRPGLRAPRPARSRTDPGRGRRDRPRGRGGASRAPARRARATPARRRSRAAPRRASAAGPRASGRCTAATTPAHGSSSSTGASEPFASSAPEWRSDRYE